MRRRGARNLRQPPDMTLTTLLAPSVRRRIVMMALQAGLAGAGYLAAMALLYGDVSGPVWQRFIDTLPYLLGARLIVAHRAGLDRGYWCHVGLRDLLRVTGGIVAGSVLFAVLLALTGSLWGLLPALFLVEAMCTGTLWIGVRVVTRVVHERRRRRSPQDGARALVIGAGEAGEQIVRQLQHDGRDPVHVVGLVDDDPEKHGRSLHGVPVLGPAADLRRLAALHDATLALIAIPSIAPEALRELVDRCTEADLDVKLVPPLGRLVSGDVHLSDTREVRIEDLLGREPVALDGEVARPELAGRVILVSGAAGSIGSELVRQIAAFHPARLLLVDRAESPLNDIHLEITRAHPEVQVVPVLASVTNAVRMERVMEQHQPDSVFHAAAYKHVPMLEWNMVEGVWNNVFGTQRLAEVSARCGVRKFVLVSTDKVVNPTSVLGATKRVAERIVLEHPAIAPSAMDCRVVRFGNVLGSDGSVLPLFQRQLADGGPLTVTHPEVRRYFMTIPEAAQLVLQAAALPEAGDRVALLEMGEQIRILDLAEQLIRTAGLVPHRDIQIAFTGLRPGEKMFEELVGPGETAEATGEEKIRLVRYDRAADGRLERALRTLARATARRDETAIVRALAALAPEYRPPQPVPVLHGHHAPPAVGATDAVAVAAAS